MQNKIDKGTSLVSKSLPVAIFNSVNRLLYLLKNGAIRDLIKSGVKR